MRKRAETHEEKHAGVPAAGDGGRRMRENREGKRDMRGRKEKRRKEVVRQGKEDKQEAKKD